MWLALGGDASLVVGVVPMAQFSLRSIPPSKLGGHQLSAQAYPIHEKIYNYNYLVILEPCSIIITCALL
jgi:hypothetical protein